MKEEYSNSLNFNWRTQKYDYFNFNPAELIGENTKIYSQLLLFHSTKMAQAGS